MRHENFVRLDQVGKLGPAGHVQPAKLLNPARQMLSISINSKSKNDVILFIFLRLQSHKDLQRDTLLFQWKSLRTLATYNLFSSVLGHQKPYFHSICSCYSHHRQISEQPTSEEKKPPHHSTLIQTLLFFF